MCCFWLYNCSNWVNESTRMSLIAEYPFWFLFCITSNIFLSAESNISSTSCVWSYPKLINSFAVFISALKADFSSTIFMYCSTLAVVGTLSGSCAIYSNPPTASNCFIDWSSVFKVIISTGSARLYKFKIAS